MANNNFKIIKYIFFVIVLFSISLCSCSQEHSEENNVSVSTSYPVDNASPEPSQSPIATQTPNYDTTTYKVPDALVYEDNSKNIKYTFSKDSAVGLNTNGEEVISIRFHSNGKIKSKTEYFITNSTSPWGITYDYYDSGLLSSVIKFKAGLSVIESATTKYVYEDISIFDFRYNGTPKKQVATFNNGSKAEFYYNTDGLVYKEIYFDSMLRKGRIAYDISYEYDEYKKISSMVKNYYDETGYRIIKTVIEKYDINGNVIYQSIKENDTVTDNEFYYDDKFGLVLCASCYDNGYIKEYSFNGVSFGGKVDLDGTAKVDLNYFINYEDGKYYFICKDYPHIYGQKLLLGVKKSYKNEDGKYYEYYYDNDGNVTYKYQLEYNSLGKKSHESLSNQINGNTSYVFSYTYNYINSKIDSIIEIINDNTCVYKYESSGQISSVTRIDSAELSYTLQFEYSDNRSIKSIYIARNQEKIISIDYNNSNNETERKIIKDNYIYIFSGHFLINKTALNTDIEPYYVEFEYNNAGALIKTIEKNVMKNIIQYIDFYYDSSLDRTSWSLKNQLGNEIIKFEKDSLISGDAMYDENGMLSAFSAYDLLGNKAVLTFKNVSKEVFDSYQKCNIYDLIPMN